LADESSEINSSPETIPFNSHGTTETRHKLESKPAFIEPRLICHGRLVDLTTQFGGSLTPEERESQGYR
jgi:hypothetical protein